MKLKFRRAEEILERRRRLKVRTIEERRTRYEESKRNCETLTVDEVSSNLAAETQA
jgi:precorrin-6B methylase 2